MASASPPLRAATAALLIIGREILSGKVEDANGPFLIRALRERGIQVTQMRLMDDTVSDIAQAVSALAPAVGYLLTTGGIGPTHDDVTLAAVAQAFGRPLVQHPTLRELLKQRYGQAMNAARWKMADVPQGAQVQLETGSLVPIVQLANVFILPGVPALVHACFAQVAKGMHGTPFHARALLLDAAESDIAAGLEGVQSLYPEVAIGSYPHLDAASYHVKVTLDGRDAQRVHAAFQALCNCLDSRWIVGEE